MRIRTIFFASFLLSSFAVIGQYKNDNVLYRLVYFQDLCKTMEENPGYLLLDVRSKGEYEDTSSFVGLNIGRFKNATNISVQDLGTRINEIKDYKDQPVFVYCSHSQRSRRASKMLADSGFKKVFNINSGFSSTHLFPASSVECILAHTERNTPYKILAPQDLVQMLDKDSKKYFLLDVRPDSIFEGKSSNEKMNTYGTIKGATHIARANLETNLDKLEPFKQGASKEIILIDAFGDESAKAAVYLTEKGYKNISLLFNGIDAWVTTAEADLPAKNKYLDQHAPFIILPSSEFPDFISKNPEALFVDVRSKEEFANQSKDSWRNIGVLQNAINIPVADIDGKNAGLVAYQAKPVLIYSFSGGEEIYRAARKLTKEGFKNVSVLAGGLFNLRWTAHNVRGREKIDDLVINVPEENL